MKAGLSELTAAQCQQLADDYVMGQHLSALRSRYGVSLETVRTVLRRQGVTVRRGGRRKTTTLSSGDVMQMRSRGMSWSEISGRTSVPVSTVRRIANGGVTAVPATGEQVQAYHDGASIPEVAEAAGLSYSTMRSRLISAGVALRPTGARPRRSSTQHS